MIGKKVLFIDRDGVINKMVLQKDGVFDSPQTVEQVNLVEGVSEIINWLNKKDIPVIEVSNQPGVAKGKMSMKTLEDIEEKVHALLEEKGVHINKIYRCFHHPEAVNNKWKVDCDCRKPNTGLLLQAASELGIDLSESAILGDNVSDMEAGKKVGSKTILFSHKNDLPQKIKVNQEYIPDFKVYSHEEVIPILIKLFS